MVTVGAVVFCVIVILAVPAQPLAAVPVTVYVPGVVKSTLELLPKPLLHA